jgi:hypothetical protein
MIAYIGCQADKLKDAVEGMNELFNKMPKSEKLIETSRKSIKNQYETQALPKTMSLTNGLQQRNLD